MEIQLGYAGENYVVGGFRSYHFGDLQVTNSIKEIRNKITYNIRQILEILKWNEENQIYLYEIPSYLIPLGSHPAFTLWQEKVKWKWYEDFMILGIMEMIKEHSTRHWITINIGPTTLENISELEYYYYLLYHLGARGLTTMVSKDITKEEWESNYMKLPEHLKNCIQLQNDSISCNVRDIANIATSTGIKPIISVKHWRSNPTKNLVNYLNIVGRLWGDYMKIHLTNKKGYKHRITLEDYMWIEHNLKESGYTGTLLLLLDSHTKEQSILSLRNGY